MCYSCWKKKYICQLAPYFCFRYPANNLSFWCGLNKKKILNCFTFQDGLVLWEVQLRSSFSLICAFTGSIDFYITVLCTNTYIKITISGRSQHLLQAMHFILLMGSCRAGHIISTPSCFHFTNLHTWCYLSLWIYGQFQSMMVISEFQTHWSHLSMDQHITWITILCTITIMDNFLPSGTELVDPLDHQVLGRVKDQWIMFWKLQNWAMVWRKVNNTDTSSHYSAYPGQGRLAFTNSVATPSITFETAVSYC